MPKHFNNYDALGSSFVVKHKAFIKYVKCLVQMKMLPNKDGFCQF